MHVMRNLGEWKMPISRIFGVPDPSGSFLGLAQPFCAFCTFYHILLISLSHAYRLFLHYALLHRFDCDSFCSCKHLCACFITFHAAFYNLQFAAMVFICFCVGITLRVSTRSFLWMLLYVWMLIAYNIKLQRPMAASGRIGLCHGSLRVFGHFSESDYVNQV